MKPLAESCSRQLRGWADSLQNTEIKGQRHLNEKSRADWEKSNASKKGADAFAAMEREMIAKLDPSHPARIERHRRNGPL